MDDSYDSASIENLSSDKAELALYEALLSELEMSLSSSTSSRTLKTSSLSRTNQVSTNLSSSQISMIVEAVRKTIIEKSLQNNKNLADLYPEILESAQSQIGLMIFSSYEITEILNAINLSLLKSSKSRLTLNQESNKNSIDNILKIITEKTFSNLDEAGVEVSNLDNASSEIIKFIIGNLDQTDITINDLDNVLDEVNATAINNLGNISGMDLSNLESVIESIADSAIDSLDLIQVTGIELDNLTNFSASITSGLVRSLGDISVTGYSVDNVSTFTKIITTSVVSALDKIDKSNYDSSVLEKMLGNISSSSTLALSHIYMEGYDVSQMSFALEASIEGLISALDEIQIDTSSSSRSSAKITNYNSHKLGSMLERITTSATGVLGDIEMENYSADNITHLSEKITFGAASGLNGITNMTGFSVSDNASAMLEKITEGMISAIKNIKRNDFSKKKYKKMIRKITKSATKSIKKLKIPGLNSQKLKQMVKKISKGGSKGINNIADTDNSSEVTLFATQVVSGINESITSDNITSLTSESLSTNDLLTESKAGGKEGLESFSSVNVNYNSMDLKSPTISNISPGNNDTGIAETSKVIITFDEAMNQESINSETFKVSLGGDIIEGIFSYTSNKSTFTATNGLGSGKDNHKVKLKLDEITDLSGNSLKSSLLGDTWYFKTKDSTPPTVVSINPINNSNSIKIDSEIEIKFSESVDNNTLTTNGCSGSLKIYSTIKPNSCLDIDQLVWNSDKSLLAIITSNQFDYNTTYEVKVGTNVKDLANNAFQTEFSSRFTTEKEEENNSVTDSNNITSRTCSFSTSLWDNNTSITFNKIYSDWKGIPSQVSQDEECGYVVSGTNSKKAWFAKIDKEGEPKGQETYEFEAPFGGPNAMIRTKDGGYLSVFSHGLIKVDKDLNFKWKNTKKLHGQIPPYYNDVIQNGNNFYAVQ